MMKPAETFADKSSLMLNWFESRISNGIIEGFNSVHGSAKNRARGYADLIRHILSG